MSESTGFYPAVHVDEHGTGIVSQAGATVLLEAINAVGLDHQLRAALAPWKKPFAWHDPAKIVLDQVVSLATGGDCLADVDRFRNQPGALFGAVASLPTVTRLLADLAADRNQALAAINHARSVVRAQAWQVAGWDSPVASATADDPLIIDIDATLVTSHSDNKEEAAGTYKKGFGFHPISAYVDHGVGRTGEGLAIMLRSGNAAANKAADHITVTCDALDQLPAAYRTGTQTLLRTASAGGGRVGRAVADTFDKSKVPYTIVEQDPSRVPRHLEFVEGDAADLEVLELAGLHDASGVIITTHDDDLNVYLTLYCHRLRPELQVISRATSEHNVPTLYRAGADGVLSYAAIGATAMSNQLGRSHRVVIAEGSELFTLPLPRSLEGVTLRDRKIYNSTGCHIVGTLGPNNELLTREDHVSADQASTLLVVGDRHSERAFRKAYLKKI